MLNVRLYLVKSCRLLKLLYVVAEITSRHEIKSVVWKMISILIANDMRYGFLRCHNLV